MENIARIASQGTRSVERINAPFACQCASHRSLQAARVLPLTRRPEAAVRRLYRVFTHPLLRLSDYRRDSGEVVLAERARALRMSFGIHEGAGQRNRVKRAALALIPPDRRTHGCALERVDGA